MESNVIQIDTFLNRSNISKSEYVEIGGLQVIRPVDASDFLTICKKFLTESDYRDILCSILDEDIYDELDIDEQRIVDAYFSYVDDEEIE